MDPKQIDAEDIELNQMCRSMTPIITEEPFRQMCERLDAEEQANRNAAVEDDASVIWKALADQERRNADWWFLVALVFLIFAVAGWVR